MHWSFTRVSSCSDFTGKLLVIWILGDHLWKVKLFTRGCQVGLCFSGICNSVVGFVAFCTRLGSIRGCGSLRVSLAAGFVLSRNASPQKQLRGRLLRAHKFINLGFRKPSSSLREELRKILYKEEMSKIQLSQPLMHKNLFFSYTLLIYMPLSRPFKQEENLFKHKERRHHCTLFRHYRDRSNSPNLRRTTHETLDLKKRGEDQRKLTRQALGTVNYNRHYSTIFQLQATQLLLTGLAGE